MQDGSNSALYDGGGLCGGSLQDTCLAKRKELGIDPIFLIIVIGEAHHKFSPLRYRPSYNAEYFGLENINEVD